MVSGIHQLAREALRLRAWALQLLLEEAAPTPPPAVSAAAWAFFARMEWCALPLQHRLETADAADLVPVTVRAVHDAAVALEAARVHSAQERLAALAQRARDRGLRVIVLKGGVAVAHGAALHLEDLDLALHPLHARTLAELLDPDGRHGRWSLGQYRIAAERDSDVAIEVHANVREAHSTSDMIRDAVPLPGYPGLWQPEPAQHLWHLLVHCTATHPDRVARLRDLLLLRTALDVDAQTLRVVEERAATHPAARSLQAVLALARTGSRDPQLERYVRRRYFLLARWEGLGRYPSLRMLLIIASELTARPRAPVIRKLFERPDRPSVVPGMELLYEHARHLDSVLRLALRPVMLLGAFGLSAGAALEERMR